MRASLLGVLQSDFVVALRASGISERAIILKHGLKNALIPVITVIGFRVTLILDGSFVIETVFALPGLGSTLVAAVLFQDIPIIQSGEGGARTPGIGICFDYRDWETDRKSVV